MTSYVIFFIPARKSEFSIKIRKSHIHSSGYLERFFFYLTQRKLIITINWSLLQCNEIKLFCTNFKSPQIYAGILFCFAVIKLKHSVGKAFKVFFSFWPGKVKLKIKCIRMIQSCISL